ncbi:hypothetical protein MMC10_001139 [Thelotrema lepadinum]|nr:hypothetical protein [Thelotrema lepadinum]
MRQRSTFIPSIVRSLTSVLGRSSSHERFKSAKLPSKLNQELWHLAQRSLRRNDALKRTYSFSAEENESMLAHDTVSFLRVTGQPLSQLTSLQGTWNIADSVIDDENILSEENSDDGFGIGSEYVHADTLDFEMLDFDLLEAQNGRSNNDWEMLDDQADTSDSRHMLVEKQGDNMDEEEMLSD